MSLRKSPDVVNISEEEGGKNERIKYQIADFFDKYGAHDAVSEILKII